MSKSAWLRTTMDAVRDIMVRRLETHSLDPESEREIQMALEELEVMWDELQGRAEMLTRENERYAEFFDYAPDAYVITDAGGNVREANHAAAELLGAPKQTMVGTPLGDFIAAGHRVKYLSAFVGLFVDPHEAMSTWESALRAADGQEKPVSLSVRGLPLKRSGVRGLCWLIRAL